MVVPSSIETVLMERIFETQPRGRDLLKVVSVGEEGECLVDRAFNPLLAAQCVGHSTHSLSLFSIALLRLSQQSSHMNRKILVGFFIERAAVAPAHRTVLVEQNQIGRIR